MLEDQFEKFMQILSALNEHKVDYVLIGGFAVILYGFNRPTEDIDLMLQLMPNNVDNLRKALRAVFDDDAIFEITANDLEEYSVIRYGTPDDFYIDIIARIGEAFSFKDIEYKVIEIKGVPLKVATPEMLYKMKKNTYREKDQMDLLFLKKLIRDKV